MSLDGHFSHDYSAEEAQADRLDYQHSQRVAAVVSAAGNPPLVVGEPVVIQRPAGPMIFFRALDSAGEWREGIVRFSEGSGSLFRDLPGGCGCSWGAKTRAPWVGYRRGDESCLAGVEGRSATLAECIADAVGRLHELADRRRGRGSCLAIAFHAARPGFWDETGSPLPRVEAAR